MSLCHGEIRAHIYCSYSLSPTGYHYGVFQYDDNSLSKDSYYLKEDGKLRFVSSSFENGYIVSAKGLMPGLVGNERYVYLIRKYRYVFPQHDDLGKEVNMNMAFEFESFVDFITFASSFESSEKRSPDELKHQLAEFIQPAGVPIFALTICRAKFNDFMSEMLSGEPLDKYLTLNDHIRISVISSSRDYTDDLRKLYGSPVKRSNGNSKVYYIPPKKSKNSKSNNSDIGDTQKKTNLIAYLLMIFLVTAILIYIIGATRQHKTEIVVNERTIQEQLYRNP